MARTNYFRVFTILAAIAAAILAASLLVLVAAVEPAQAAFPGSNGKVLFTSSRDFPQWEIYSMNRDGSSQTNLTNHPAFDQNPAFSPDTSKITFQSNRDGNYEIYVMNKDGSDQKRLTNNDKGDGQPAFSPDGKKIAFQSDRDGNSEVYVMDVADVDGDGNGDNQTNLTENTGSDRNPVFSPDGSKIAFESLRDGDFDIFVMNADGSNPTNLTKNLAVLAGEPTYSPDSKKIAFVGTIPVAPSGNNQEIFVMNADGSNPTNLTNDPARDTNPAFSPDGRQIAFDSHRESDTEIYAINVDGSGAPTNLSNNSVDDFWPDWGVANPPNDDFADARVVNGSTASIPGTTSPATRETNEPDHSSGDTPNEPNWLGDHSVWYRWTAPSSGSMVIQTCTSNIDSILAVYTGSSLNALSRVADDNNSCLPSSWGSKVAFNAQAGTTYQIAVGDAGGLRQSTFTLRLAQDNNTAPAVTQVNPPLDKTRVRRSTSVTATFSEAMDPATLDTSTVTLLDTTNGATVPATVSYDEASRKVTLDPSGKLARLTKYEATIKGGTNGVKDLTGDALAVDRVWSFTTGRR